MSDITMIEVDGIMNFSCGCKAQKIGHNFVITPCSPICEVYQYSLQESIKRGSKISIVDGTEDKR